MVGKVDADQSLDGAFLVWRCNWDTVLVFRNLIRCWRIDSMNGVYLGLDRPSIESTLRLMGFKAERHTELFNDLMVMEEAALEVLNKGKY